MIDVRPFRANECVVYHFRRAPRKGVSQVFRTFSPIRAKTPEKRRKRETSRRLKVEVEGGC